MEITSLLSTLFNFLQLLVSISCVWSLAGAHPASGFALNCLILNPVLMVIQGVRYWQHRELFKTYYSNL